MPDILFNLKDKAILDTGEVLVKYPRLLSLARDGIDFHSLKCFPDSRIDDYNKIVERELIQVIPDGEISGPELTIFEWNTPKPWKDIDLSEFCSHKLYENNLIDSIYIDRLVEELNELTERNMTQLICHLIYIIDTWTKRNIVWGVGRGSSCASLVMFLIGVTRIDPVKYDIPISEFFR